MFFLHHSKPYVYSITTLNLKSHTIMQLEPWKKMARIQHYKTLIRIN